MPEDHTIRFPQREALLSAAREALRLIRLAEEDLADNADDNSRRAANTLHAAALGLAPAIAANEDDAMAQQRLREALLAVLGPGVRLAEIRAGRRLLKALVAGLGEARRRRP